MDQAVIQYYRQLLKQEFPNAGELDHPSVFVEAVGEELIHCGNTGNYMQLYLQVVDERIVEIKYRCACEPVANVAVEILCDLVKGKTLDEASRVTEEPFYELLGSRNEKLGGKVKGLLQLLNKGIAGDRRPTAARDASEKSGGEQGDKVSWDGTLST